MADFDAFNGDADGICALQQLRLASPRESQLITGVKRDIALLRRIDAAPGDRVSALDISLDKNRDDVLRLLEQGAQVIYFDHHFSGEIPAHPNLKVTIDPTPDRGTSFLVDASLDGRYRGWAVVGTFGDNFDATAQELANSLSLRQQDITAMRELGILINYNAYGSDIKDLHLPPDQLFRRIRPYQDPLDFIANDETPALLRDGYSDDMDRADRLVPELETATHGLYILPAEPWARRVSGVFANRLAQTARGRAHAILTELAGGGYLVSIRAPLERPDGADQLCRLFPSGGGRKAAAGINHLPDAQFDLFKSEFSRAFT